jgi:hypothetical protein
MAEASIELVCPVPANRLGATRERTMQDRLAWRNGQDDSTLENINETNAANKNHQPDSPRQNTTYAVPAQIAR